MYPTINAQEIGARVRAKRETLHLSRVRFARMMAVTLAHLVKVERGRACFTAAQAQSIERFLAGEADDASDSMDVAASISHDQLFSSDELRRYRSDIQETENLLDAPSDKELFAALVALRNPDAVRRHRFMKYISNTSRQYLSYINKRCVTTAIEGGVNDGHNTRAIRQFVKHVYGFEPFIECFEKSKYKKALREAGVEVFPYALWDKNEAIGFYEHPTDACSSHISRKNPTRMVRAITIDAFAAERSICVDYIKMDVEGAEENALRGAQETLRRDRPQLAIAIYHKKTHLFSIPRYLKTLLHDYAFKLSHHTATACETILYAIPHEKMPAAWY